MSDNRAACYFEGDVMVLRASSLGNCIGNLVRNGLGMSPQHAPSSLQERWAQGVKAEPLIVEEVERQGWVVSYAGEGEQLELELKVGPKIVIRCHPDGLATWLDEDGFPQHTRVLECKALRPSFDRGFLPYKWQMSVEMAASGFKGLWAYGEKDEKGELVIESGPPPRVHTLRHPKVELVPQDTPHFFLADIKRRALKIYKAVINGDIPECEYRQFPCGFYQDDGTLCGIKKEAEELPIPQRIVDEYLAAKRVKADAEADFKEISDRLKGMVKDKTGDRYKAGKLIFEKRAGRKSIDKKKLAQDGVDVNAYETVANSYWAIVEVDGRSDERQ